MPVEAALKRLRTCCLGVHPIEDGLAAENYHPEHLKRLLVNVVFERQVPHTPGAHANLGKKERVGACRLAGKGLHHTSSHEQCIMAHHRLPKSFPTLVLVAQVFCDLFEDGKYH